MANLQHITQGALDRLTGQLFQGTGPLGDELRARAVATFQSEVADEQADLRRRRDAILIEMHDELWRMNERMCELFNAVPDDAVVRELRFVLDDALKGYEVLADEVLA
jgi:hypothetical protein